MDVEAVMVETMTGSAYAHAWMSPVDMEKGDQY